MRASLLMVSILLPACAAPVFGAEKPPDPTIRKLQTELVASLKELLASRKAQWEAGKISSEEALEAAKLLRDAELDLAAKPTERVAAHLAYFALAVKADEEAVGRFEAGSMAPVGFQLIRAERIRAEIDLRKAGGSPPRGTKPAAKPKPPAKPTPPAKALG